MDMDANNNAIAATVATSTIHAANLPTNDPENEPEHDNENNTNDYVLPNGPSVYTMFGGGCGVESCSGGSASMIGGGSTNSGSVAYKWQKRRQFSIPSALLFTNGPNGRDNDHTNAEHIHITYNYSGPCDAGAGDINMGHATTNDSLVDDIHDMLIANAQQFHSQPQSQSHQSPHMLAATATKARRKTKRRDIKLQSKLKSNPTPKTNSPYRKSKTKTKTKRRAKK